jgi:hypothetical protein
MCGFSSCVLSFIDDVKTSVGILSTRGRAVQYLGWIILIDAIY